MVCQRIDFSWIHMFSECITEILHPKLILLFIYLFNADTNYCWQDMPVVHTLHCIFINFTFCSCNSVNCMEYSPAWEANNYSDRQDIPHILWNLQVPYQANKSLPVFLILRQMIQSAHSDPISVRSILALFSCQCLGLPTRLFALVFPTEALCAFLLSPMHSTFPSHLVPLHFLTQ